jgi:hypothetical protein
VDPIVILDTPASGVTPGAELHLGVRVRNPGRRVEGYELAVLGPLGPFSRLEPAELSVFPGREEAAELVVAPPSTSVAPSGTIPIAVRARSLVDPAASSVAETDIDVGGSAGLDARAVQTMRRGRWSARFAVELTNRGNTPLRLILVGHDPAGDLSFKIHPETVDIAPGGRVVSSVKARARQPFLRGSAVVRPFEVACHDFPFGRAKPLPGTPATPGDALYRNFPMQLQQQPVVSKVMMAVAGLAVLGAALVFLLFARQGSGASTFGFDAPGEPTGVAATPSSSTSITVRWVPVAGATGYDVLSDGGQKLNDQPIEALQSQFEQTDLEPQSEHCYTVVALGPNGEGGTRQSGPSEETCTTTPPQSTVPPPTDVRSATDAGQLVLEWEHEDADNHEFLVVVDGATDQASRFDGSGRPFPVEEPGTYGVQVIAVDKETGDQSDPSEEIEVEVPVPACTEDCPPTRLHVAALEQIWIQGRSPGDPATVLAQIQQTVDGMNRNLTVQEASSETFVRDDPELSAISPDAPGILFYVELGSREETVAFCNDYPNRGGCLPATWIVRETLEQ